ncbi:MFS general substrate transporter [Russula aff. rugulosa BPL654]|nr:MFS general substrate transporter [Russula aff. rugulosa BPL654]
MAHLQGRSKTDLDEKDDTEATQVNTLEMDLTKYHEQRVGSLVLDPDEARVEFGETVASRLKLSPDGKIVLWPQPSDDPEDPQNWPEWQKTIQLVIITLTAFVPDFDSAIGIPSLFALAKQDNTTPAEINNLTSNWSIFLIGWGGIFAVMLMRRYGRLPVLFWSQLLALGFLVGCAFAPNLKTFAAMRCLTAFFGTCPQVTGLYVVTDMYPFHRQARMLNVWTMGFIISPFLSPFAFGFLVARTRLVFPILMRCSDSGLYVSWRWAYGIACMYGLSVLSLIVFFGRETIYDRGLKDLPSRPTSSLQYRIEMLIGITGVKMAKYRATWYEAVSAPFRLFWRPHLLGILVFEALLFGFGIGINVTNVVFLGSPSPVGFGFSQYAIAGAYATPMVVFLFWTAYAVTHGGSPPQVAVIIGEIIGHFANDAIMRVTTRRNHGVFEAESRLWACYVAVPLYVCGFLALGTTFQKHDSIAAVVMGWGIAQVAIMLNTVAVYAYANDCFPKYQGEISALLNLARTLGGFSVAYFQVPWATKHGALQTFGCEAAIVAGLFVLIVPITQLTGRTLRRLYSY